MTVQGVREQRPAEGAGSCPICFRLPRAGTVCDRCGVDVRTGDLVQAPERVGRPEIRAASEPEEAWGLAAVGRRVGEGAFGALAVTAVMICVQALLVFGIARAGGSLFLLAYVLISRARAVVSGARPFPLTELGGELLRAMLLALALSPALVHPAGGVAVALALPLLLGALASERPLADLAPRALLAAARRSERLWLAALLSGLLLGSALAALHVTGVLDLWWPPLAVGAASVAAVAAGLARRAAEIRR